MDVRKKKWLTCFVAFCMALSVLTGLGPTGFLVHAATGASKPIISGNTVTFRFTTPSAYAVYLTGDFNGWAKEEIALKQQDEGDEWQTTISVEDYEKLANNKNEYKFMIRAAEDSTAVYEEGNNHILYRKAFLINDSDVSVIKGKSCNLPDGIFYNEEAQTEKAINASQIEFALTESVEGVILDGNVLTVAETFTGDSVGLTATYNEMSATFKVSVLAEAFEPVVFNADGTITFNAIYNGDTLYYIGSLTDNWANQKAMRKVNGIFTYTTETPVAPGIYEYKFKPNADDWNNSFNAENSGDGNSKIIVPGMSTVNVTVEKGTPCTLPTEVTLYKEDGETEKVAVTYSLDDDLDTVTLEGNILTVSKEFTDDTLVLTMTSGDLTGKAVVTTSNSLCTYTINYVRNNEDYTDWNLWLWTATQSGANYEFTEGLQGEYMQGIYQIDATTLNFIVKRGDWLEKDIDKDREITMPEGQKSVEVWLVQGDATVYYEKPDLSKHVMNAFMDSTQDILVNLSAEASDINTFVLKDDAGNIIATQAVKMSETRLKLTITDGTSIDVSKLYTVESPTFKGANVTMRGILDDPQYYYEGDDLGLTYSQSQSTFKVWAPTASEVKLSVYDTPERYEGVETAMQRLSSGVWSLTLNEDLVGKYYLYVISFADGTTNYVVDPYAKAVSINGGKTAIIDLETTNPQGFDPEAGPRAQNATDAIVYELHVRDMSSQENNGFGDYEGKYLAFTKEGLTTKEGNPIGIDHLKSLGITHVQLQPIYDYATVDETNITSDNYNWGYDPQNYNVPEGSYATDPSNPACRITEVKQMIQALHNAGIGVIMDVVYNHTYNIATGPFEKVVPGYYYRSDDDGNYTNGSGCGNEVASERPMVRKFIKDSVKYWATEYGMDGFRFDLMGLIDTETIKQITKELKEEVNPNIIVYGEPWTGGTSGLASESQTLKGSQKGTDFGVFNDNIRNAIKGDSDEAGPGFATGSTGQEGDIVEGVQGAIHTIATNPTEMVTYVTAHDNLNLWDKVLKVLGLDAENPYDSITESDVLENEAVKRSILANGIVFTSQGISFMHAGEEMLRTKFGDHNSYKSPDNINMIRWENRDDFAPVFDYYQGLIALRKAHPAFRMTTATDVENHFNAYIQKDNVVAFALEDYANGDNWNNITVIYNANETAQTVSLPHEANWHIVVNAKKAGTTVLETLESASSVEVAPLSMMVLYDEAKDYVAEPTTISVVDEEIGMAIGDSKLLKVTVKDQNGAAMSGQTITYTSSNEDVVTVSSNGKLTAKGVGKAEVTLQCGEAKLILQVNVVKELIPTKLTVTGSKSYVYETRTLQLSALVYDQFNKEMLNAKVKWSSSDGNVATVDAYGKVTGISEGQATITATVNDISEEYIVYVKSYEKRYIVLEYIREDKDYTDWNLWTWSTGVSDGQVDFTVKDDKASALIEIGPDTTSVGFIVRKGTDWSTCKQDISADRYVYTDVDQVITKARIYEMVNDVETLESATAPVIHPEEDCITFYYRNNGLFKTGDMNQIAKVAIEINDTLYDMTYDDKNERFIYDYKGLEVGKYYYRYHVTFKNGDTTISLDANNPAIENNKSVLTYEKYDLTVTATASPSAFNYKTSSRLDVTITSEEKEEIVIKKIIADLSALGGASEVPIDPTLRSIALSVNDTISAGMKQIPITVYDAYGNTYKTEAQVEVATITQTEDFDWDEAVIYFMLTDRFNNGDINNDDPLEIGYDKSQSGTYHGGDFKGITAKLDYLKDLGINTIWISPIVEQIGQNIGNSANPYYAYHGYWAKDFEELNPHFGSLEDLKELIDAAHDRGIKIMVDVVINHAGYGLKEGETGTDPNFPSLADQAKYAGMFRTDGSTDTVYGEISGLPDFITEDAGVRETVLNWQTAWIEKCMTDKGNTIDYFRVDTAKHVDKATLQALKIAATKVKPDFKYILEAWYSGSDLDAYLNKGYADGVLNFDFKEIAKQFVNGNLESAEASLETLNEKVSSSATYGNFLGSHDEDGFLYSIGKDNIGGLKNAITLQATSKGQPVIYYGEELGLSGANNYPQYDNRYDMNWQLATAENDILSHYQKVLNIRKQYSKLFAKGTREKLAGSDAEGFIAFARTYKDEVAVVAINNGEAKQVSLKVPFKTGSTITDAYSTQTYTVSNDGSIKVNLPAAKEGGTIILIGTKESGNPSGGTSSDDDKPSNNTGNGGSGGSNVGSGSSNVVNDNKQPTENTNNKLPVIAEKHFTDITADHWAKDYIEALAARNILQGRTETTFDGKSAITRAEFAAMLGRALNLTGTNKESDFKDVKAESWYAGYVSELKALGLITGYTDQTFKPNQKITRQEMAVLIVKAYNYMMNESLNDVGDITFKDTQKIAPWALESIKVAYSKGIINGTPENTFLPTQTASRAETAKMLFKLLEITGAL